jgi:hypothetical protein
MFEIQKQDSSEMAPLKSQIQNLQNIYIAQVHSLKAEN